MTKKVLTTKIRKATFAAFKKALKEIGTEQLCGFALYTDESAMSLSVSINAETYLNKAAKRDPDNRTSYQWSPAEWKEEGYQEQLFAKLNDELYDYHEKLSDEDSEEKFTKFTRDFFETCVSVLKELKKSVPKGINKDFVVLFDISDYDDTDTLIAWVKKLNPPKKAKEYEKMWSDF
jgi:uncharacterized protein YihD (DUF1040 family)